MTASGERKLRKQERRTTAPSEPNSQQGVQKGKDKRQPRTSSPDTTGGSKDPSKRKKREREDRREEDPPRVKHV